MGDERVYADATTLIGLARIDRLDLLSLLPTPILVTDYVWAEVASDPKKPGTFALIQARVEALLEIVSEGDPNAFPELDPGESTVLSAAATAGAGVLVDERKARALIDSDPQLNGAIRQATGIVGLILLAKHTGLISTVKPLLDALIREHFWLSPNLYSSILQQANEG